MGQTALGIDIGGTGTKAALVDLETGKLISERARTGTPKPATRAALTSTVRELAQQLLHAGPPPEVTGLAFPGVVRRGVALTAVNLGEEWMYADLGQVFGEALETDIWALNDADAAALAEARFGAGRHHAGTVVVVTLGTGVGTSLIIDNHLVPNIELGCLEIRGRPAGERVANSVRKRKRLSWDDWAADLQIFLERLEEAVAPDLVIIGGGVSEEASRFMPKLRSRAKILPARLANAAGIVGAAAYAGDQVRRRSEKPSESVSQLMPANDDGKPLKDLMPTDSPEPLELAEPADGNGSAF